MLITNHARKGGRGPHWGRGTRPQSKSLYVQTVRVSVPSRHRAPRSRLAVEMADEAVFIGPPAPGESYLVLDKILEAIVELC